MKKLYACLLALGFSLSLQAQASFSVDLVAANPEIYLGEDLLVQVQVSGLTQASAPALGAYDLNLHYDSTLFALQSIVWGDALLGDQLDVGGFGSLQSSDSSAPGLLNFFQVSFDSPEALQAMQFDSFTLFSLVFSAIATGNADFTLASNALGDAFGNSLTADSIAGSSVTVAPVPLPAALPLLLSALGLLGVARHHRKA